MHFLAVQTQTRRAQLHVSSVRRWAEIQLSLTEPSCQGLQQAYICIYFTFMQNITRVARNLAVIACLAGRGLATPVFAQEPATSFAVASIRANHSGDMRSMTQSMAGGLFRAVNVPLRSLVAFAYDLPRFQIRGLTGWMNDERFDVTARADGDPPLPVQRANLRALLAERFGLTAHRDSVEQDLYRLRLDRRDGQLGAGLRPSSADCANAGPPAGADVPCGYFGPPPNVPIREGRLSFRGLSIDVFARSLSAMVQRVVVNDTGLSGYYDADFEATAELPPPPPPPGVGDPIDRPNLPSIFTVVRERLGLRLEPGRGPVDMLVVDRAEHPSPD